MANELSIMNGVKISAVAGEALAANRQVTIDFTAEPPSATYVAAAGGQNDGVTAQDADSGQMVDVYVDGIVSVKVVTAASIVKNSYLQSNDAGQALLGATADICILKSLQPGGADGNIILAKIIDPVTIA